MVVYTRSALVSLSTNDNLVTDNRPPIETPTLSPSSHPVIATPIPGNQPTLCPTPAIPFDVSHGDENTLPSTTDTPAILLSTEATTTAQPPATSTQSPPPNVAPEHPPAGLDQIIEDLAAAPVTAGAAFASSTSVCSPQYSKKKERTISEFKFALKKMSPKYDEILKPAVHVPSFFVKKNVESLFVVLSGQGDKRKKVQVLNEMLIDWVAEKSNKNGGYPTPATITNSVRTLLAATKDQFSWDFSMNDFKFDGGFNGFFKHLCAERQRMDVSFPCSAAATAAQLQSQLNCKQKYFPFHNNKNMHSPFFTLPYLFNW